MTQSRNSIALLRAEDSQVALIQGHEKAFEDFRVVISFDAFQKMMFFVDSCPYEISGFGIVEESGSTLSIKEVFLVKQSTSSQGLHVETDQKAFNEFVGRLAKNGGDPGKLKFQWHSHANSRVFFSCEDVDTIRAYLCDYMISCVLNKKGEHRCRIDIFKPLKVSLDSPLHIQLPEVSDDLKKRYLLNMKDCVRVVGQESKDATFCSNGMKKKRLDKNTVLHGKKEKEGL